MCQMKSLQFFDAAGNLILRGIPSCLDNITFWKKSSSSTTHLDYFTKEGKLYYLVTAGQRDIELEIKTSLQIQQEVYTLKGVPLSLMIVVDMSSNKLIGRIRFKMGELSQLQSFNLSNNFLMGSVPNSFQNLKNMESLNLSCNKLSGEIPYELVVLTSLSTFIVAYNNLLGRVPFDWQFSTFETKSYDGNVIQSNAYLQ